MLHKNLALYGVQIILATMTYIICVCFRRSYLHEPGFLVFLSVRVCVTPGSACAVSSTKITENYAEYTDTMSHQYLHQILKGA